MNRCVWPKTEEDICYHDNEWGFPTHDDKILFEYLVLEMMQAGLSWSLILKKRNAMKIAFSGFDYNMISTYSQNKIDDLLQNKDIIRNKLKLKALVNNAQLFMKIQEEFESFDKYIWKFTNYKSIHNGWNSQEQIPTFSTLSDLISKDLKKRGFKFVGTTICYSYLQAIGMINDHLVTCDCYRLLIKKTSSI